MDLYNPMPGYGLPGARQPQDSATLLFVQDLPEIERVAVLPGQRVFVMALNDSVLAARTGTPMGTETTYCRLEEFVPEAPAAPDYVTKADLEELLRRYMGEAPAAPLSKEAT